MKHLFLSALMATLLAQPVLAHDSHGQPKWGGAVGDAGLFQAELVIDKGEAKVYLSLHADMLPAEGASGKLTLLSGKDKEELQLQPVSYGALGAPTRIRPGKDVKGVATITLPAKGTGTVRFSFSQPVAKAPAGMNHDHGAHGH